MPLTLADKNKNYIITKINGRDDVKRHLNNLGFRENETITIKQAISGNLIVEVKGVRVAISDNLARRIMI